MTDFTIIARSLSSRRFSTLVTALTVAVAVALMLILLTMKNAARKAFERGSGDMHMLVSADASPLVSVLNGIFYANPPRRPLAWSQVQKLTASIPTRGNGYAIPVQQGDSFRGFPVLATTPDFFSAFKPNPGETWSLREGRFFDKPFEIVLGSRVARESGLGIGDTAFLTHGMGTGAVTGDVIKAADQAPEKDAHDEHDHAGHDHEHAHADDEGDAAHMHREFGFEVVGILNPTGGSHDRAVIIDLTSTWILHAHDRRERENASVETTTETDLTDEDRLVTGVYVRLTSRDGSSSPANLPQVFDMLRRDTAITVASPSDEIRKLFLIIGSIDQLFIALAGAVMLSSGIAILLALYNSMDQRRRQIAVLRVLGCSRSRIFMMVLTESALIGMLGAAIGVALAIGGAWIAGWMLKQRLGLVLDSVPAGPLVLIVVAAAIILAACAGLIPAMVAYRTSVAKNLRPTT